MDYDFHSELESLENMISRLEGALANVDSERDKEKEAIEQFYERKKERLQSKITPLKTAREAFLESDQTEENSSELPKKLPIPPAKQGDGAPFNGSSDVGLNGKARSKFSIRLEVENLLSELEPNHDVIQGEITRTLQNRFPQHEDSIKAATVSSVLRRLANAGVLVRVSEGSGSEPNRYRVPAQETEVENQEELSELRE